MLNGSVGALSVIAPLHSAADARATLPVPTRTGAAWEAHGDLCTVVHGFARLAKENVKESSPSHTAGLAGYHRAVSKAPKRPWWASPWNLLALVLWTWVLIRFAPHAAAALGIETGPGTSPALTVTTLDGEELALEDLRGRVVLVNFWATWCPPCRVEMPLLQAMAERHTARGLVVLGLSVDRGPAREVKAFLTERGITYPVAIVGPGAERAFGGVRGYPTSFLLDRSGRIRQEALGPLAMVSFEPAVRRLLAE